MCLVQRVGLSPAMVADLPDKGGVETFPPGFNSDCFSKGCHMTSCNTPGIGWNSLKIGLRLLGCSCNWFSSRIFSSLFCRQQPVFFPYFQLVILLSGTKSWVAPCYVFSRL